MVQWTIHGTIIEISIELHAIAIKPVAPSNEGLLKPNNPSPINDGVRESLHAFNTAAQNYLDVYAEEDFSTMLDDIIVAKVEQFPSYTAEYDIASQLWLISADMLGIDTAIGFLLYGTPVQPLADWDTTAISHTRVHVWQEILTYLVTIGGGFKSVGLMENYRAYEGGDYADDTSYRNYTPGGTQ